MFFKHYMAQPQNIFLFIFLLFHQQLCESLTLSKTQKHNTNIGFSNIMPIFMACDKSISSRAAFDYYYKRNSIYFIFIQNLIIRTSIPDHQFPSFNVKFFFSRKQKIFYDLTILRSKSKKIVAEKVLSPSKDVETLKIINLKQPKPEAQDFSRFSFSIFPFTLTSQQLGENTKGGAIPCFLFGWAHLRISFIVFVG